MSLGPFTEAASTVKKSHAVKTWKLGPENKLTILTLQGRRASRERSSRNTSGLGRGGGGDLSVAVGNEIWTRTCVSLNGKKN